MVSDFSTGAMSMGAVHKLKQQGRRSDPPLFMDKCGKITDDPNAFDQGGNVLFMGAEKHGYRGYAMSLFCEAWTATAGGHCNNTEFPQRQTFVLYVTDPEAFAGHDNYHQEMKRFLEHMRSSRVRPGFDAIRLPGERAYASLAEAKTRGVPLAPDQIEKLQSLADKHNLPRLN